MKTKKLTTNIINLIAIILLSFNVAGLFIPLRDSNIYSEKSTLFKNDITLTEKQLLRLLERRETSNEIFVEKVNNTINKGIAHFWLDEGITKYNLRVPIYENYILFLASYVFPDSFKKYEFCNYRKAIERGVGLCSQHAIILSTILEKNGIATKIIGLSGHVVVMAEVDEYNDIWWVLDPDYGVLIKKNMQQIENDPKLILKYYIQKGYDLKTALELERIYGKEGNFMTNGVFHYCGSNKYYFEKFAYIGIWVIPLFLFWFSNYYSKKKLK